MASKLREKPRQGKPQHPKKKDPKKARRVLAKGRKTGVTRKGRWALKWDVNKKETRDKGVGRPLNNSPHPHKTRAPGATRKKTQTKKRGGFQRRKPYQLGKS